jgi:hypothetical protein
MKLNLVTLKSGYVEILNLLTSKSGYIEIALPSGLVWIILVFLVLVKLRTLDEWYDSPHALLGTFPR